MFDMSAAASRAKTRALRERFAAAHDRNVNAWADAWTYGSNSAPESHFWGVFENLANRPSSAERWPSAPAPCDFGPCYPKVRSCAYMALCARRAR